MTVLVSFFVITRYKSCTNKREARTILKFIVPQFGSSCFTNISSFKTTSSKHAFEEKLSWIQMSDNSNSNA